MVTESQERIIFHYALGIAISQWSHVEATIGDIVINLFKNADLSAEAIAVGYYSAEGFRVKLKLADEIVKRKLHDSPHLVEWDGLVQKARTCSGERNNLAHWMVRTYPQMQPGKRVVLSPWIREKPKTDAERARPPNGAKRIMDLVVCAEEFGKLGDAFQALFCRIYATGMQLRESRAPRGDRPTVHTLRREIAAVFSSPPKPSHQKQGAKP